jgi:hypothetical protein
LKSNINLCIYLRNRSKTIGGKERQNYEKLPHL